MPIKLISGSGGSLTVTPAPTASNYTLTVPAVTANVVTTGDTSTITPSMLSTGAPTWDSSGNMTVTGTVVGGSAMSGMRNRIINGGMIVWQRGTSFANTTTYTADRWFVNRNGGGTGVTASRSGSVGNYYLKISRDSGTSATGALDVRQVIETLNCADLAGQTVTLSFNAYVGANYSASNLAAEIRYSTATDDGVNIVGSWVSGAYSTLTLTTSSTRYSISYTIPSNALTLMVRFVGGNYSGTAGADDSVYINNVQLEKGSVVTPLEVRSYGTELALCQRYYIKLNMPQGAYLYQISSTGYRRYPISFPVIMRSDPTVTATGMTGTTSTGVDGLSSQGCACSGNATGGTAADLVYWNNGVVTASAEL